MCYRTSFEGHIKITPTLPQELIDTVNLLASGLNNMDGKGDLYSFDSIVHHLRGWPKHLEKNNKDGHTHDTKEAYYLKHHGPTKAPSNMCHWILVNQHEAINNDSGYYIDSDYSDYQHIINHHQEINNTTPMRQELITIIEWNGVQQFSEYMYWMQYLIDFVTLYAKYQFNIDIESFQGSIQWKGEKHEISSAKEDCGKLVIEPRILPEETGFYPEDIFPLPHLPTAEKPILTGREAARTCSIQPLSTRTIPSVESCSLPKGNSFKSVFGVKVIIPYTRPLQFCDLGNLRVNGGISRGGYVLFSEEQPNKQKQQEDKITISFYLHHEKSHAVYNENDPRMKCSFSREEKLKFGCQAYRKWFVSKAIAPLPAATVEKKPFTKRKNFMDLTANMFVDLASRQNNLKSSDTRFALPQEILDQFRLHLEKLKSSSAYRKCTGCGSLFDGPAYQVAAWDWIHGYTHAHIYTIYCSRHCLEK